MLTASTPHTHTLYTYSTQHISPRTRSMYRPIKKIADKYAQLCGYRQHGLKYDDLIIEENETVQTVSEMQEMLAKKCPFRLAR